MTGTRKTRGVKNCCPGLYGLSPVPRHIRFASLYRSLFPFTFAHRNRSPDQPVQLINRAAPRGKSCLAYSAPASFAGSTCPLPAHTPVLFSRSTISSKTKRKAKLAALPAFPQAGQNARPGQVSRFFTRFRNQFFLGLALCKRYSLAFSPRPALLLAFFFFFDCFSFCFEKNLAIQTTSNQILLTERIP